MFWYTRVVARSSRPTTASTDKKRVLVVSLTTGRAFGTYFMWGKGGGEESDGSVHLQE